MDYKKQMELWRSRRERAAKMAAKGVPQTRIAKMLRVTPQRISRMLKQKEKKGNGHV